MQRGVGSGEGKGKNMNVSTYDTLSSIGAVAFAVAGDRAQVQVGALGSTGLLNNHQTGEQIE